MTNAYSRYD
ncbi:Protein of unknown function [Propionibacterium freudenreichii]|nr:Protein of unknown function [Propionibacterium freudenreichii]